MLRSHVSVTSSGSPIWLLFFHHHLLWISPLSLQVISDLGGTITLTHASTSASINHELVSPDCGLQPWSNSQQESKEAAGLAVVTTENCRTVTEELGSPLSLEERKLGEDSAVVTQTSCTTGTVCQSQETGGEQKSTPAANSHAGRNIKNKRRTTKTTRRARESPGNNSGTPEAGKGTAQRQPETTGSHTEGALSPIELAEASVIGEAGITKNLYSPRTEETQLPINPASVPSGDGNCADRKAVALPTTTIVGKQEGEKWEVELLISERVVESERRTETEQEDTERLSANEAKLHSALLSSSGGKGEFYSVLTEWSSVRVTSLFWLFYITPHNTCCRMSLEILLPT